MGRRRRNRRRNTRRRNNNNRPGPSGVRTGTRVTTTSKVGSSRRLVVSPNISGSVPLALDSTIPFKWLTIGESKVIGVGTAFYLGAGELIYNSPITGFSNQHMRSIGYSRARVNSITMKVIPSAKVVERGGQLSIALVPVPFDTLESTNSDKDRDFNLGLYSLDIQDISLMRNGRIGSASRTLTTTWKPSGRDGTTMFRRIGIQSSALHYNVAPVVVALIGFTDVAAKNFADARLLYTAADATFDVEIKSSVTLSDPTGGANYISKTISHVAPNPFVIEEGFDALGMGGDE